MRVNRHLRTAVDLWAAVQTAWASIPVDVVQNLVDSLLRRVEAIRRASGGWTLDSRVPVSQDIVSPGQSIRGIV